MPTKILVWNIQNFTINKIDPNFVNHIVVPSVHGGFSFQTVQLSTMKLDYILNNVIVTDPDIFSVIEVISGRGPKGSLVSSKGAQGVLALLNSLRKLNTNWCLVPPLKLTDKIQLSEADDGHIELLSDGTYTEAIGVFYRKDRLDFVGPYVWPAAGSNDNPNKIADPRDGTVAGPYPDVWSNCLPPGNYNAGQYEFYTEDDQELLFPAEGSRRPFLTQFVERGGNQRTISLASVHYPPNQSSAITAWARTIRYFIDDYPLGDKEVVCIAGDFNINYRGEDYVPTDFYSTYYNFHTLINGKKYFPTIYQRNANATPWIYVKNQGLDNATVRYGPQALEFNPTFEFMDRVEAGNHPSLLYNDLNVIRALPTVDEQNELFRQPNNFMKLGPVPGTSDHIGMFYTI